jgi:hypothetical protein
VTITTVIESDDACGMQITMTVKAGTTEVTEYVPGANHTIEVQAYSGMVNVWIHATDGNMVGTDPVSNPQADACMEAAFSSIAAATHSFTWTAPETTEPVTISVAQAADSMDEYNTATVRSPPPSPMYQNFHASSCLHMFELSFVKREGGCSCNVLVCAWPISLTSSRFQCHDKTAATVFFPLIFNSEELCHGICMCRWNFKLELPPLLVRTPHHRSSDVFVVCFIIVYVFVCMFAGMSIVEKSHGMRCLDNPPVAGAAVEGAVEGGTPEEASGAVAVATSLLAVAAAALVM